MPLRRKAIGGSCERGRLDNLAVTGYSLGMGYRTRQCSSELSAALVALGQNETLRVFGRCYNCPDAPASGRRFVTNVYRLSPVPARTYGGNTYEHPRCPESTDLSRFPNGWVGTAAALSNGYIDCPECAQPVYDWQGVKAVYVSFISCSADCQEATGEKCRCSCNGANHGAGA